MLFGIKHSIKAFRKTYTNFKKLFLIRVFWFKFIFLITFKVPILDLILLQKNSVPFEGLYYSPSIASNGEVIKYHIFISVVGKELSV